MQRWILEPGQIVRASAGRDAGRYFLIVGVTESDLLLADGKRRKIAAPKRKNPRHVQATNQRLDLSGLTDRALRTALAPLCEAVSKPQSKRNQPRPGKTEPQTEADIREEGITDVEAGCH